MNRIVKEHYPVERLPEDLRGQLPREAKVTVTVEMERSGIASGRVASLKARRKSNFRSAADVNAYVVGLRQTSD